jgi:tetratricopeptide (TPR) repeat protein
VSRFCVPRRMACLIVAMGFAAHAFSADDARQILDRAYALTDSAATVEQFNEILQLCQQAASGPMSSDMVTYRRQLLSWAYNRRGEVFAERAAALVDPKEKEQARKLEAQALADFERAVENDPQRWKSLHNRAVSYALIGKFPEATADLRRVLQLKPDHANANFNLGEIHRDMGQNEEAVQDYTRALKLDEKDAASYGGRARAIVSLGRLQDAQRDFNRAVELAPNDAFIRAGRGSLYQRLGRWGDAALDLREAAKLDGNSDAVLQMAAWLMATCPDNRYRQTDLAVQAAERALELGDGDDSRYLDTLAAAYANANRFDDAVRTAQAALDCARNADDRKQIQQRVELYRQKRPFRQADVERGGAASSIH